MHKRAIKIKADILGEFDYEVGLSIGHLASLYNYHMKNYQEAERLYLRSINISKCSTVSMNRFATAHMDCSFNVDSLLFSRENRSPFVWRNIFWFGIRLPWTVLCVRKFK